MENKNIFSNPFKCSVYEVSPKTFEEVSPIHLKVKKLDLVMEPNNGSIDVISEYGSILYRSEVELVSFFSNH